MPRPSRVDSPELCLMIGDIVKESQIIKVRTHRERVEVPRAGFAPNFEAVKALADIWAFANRDQPAGPVIQFLPANS